MSISLIQYLSWSQLSKPLNDRIAYRAIKKYKVRSIVEFGLCEGVRCERMISIAQKYSGASTVRYTGVDPFESRDALESPLKLIDMHRKLNGMGAKAQLVPGAFADAIPRIANAHLKTDLVVIQATSETDLFEDDRFAEAWRFMPRMLHPTSQVMLFYPDNEYEVLNFIDVEKRVKTTAKEITVDRAAA